MSKQADMISPMPRWGDTRDDGGLRRCRPAVRTVSYSPLEQKMLNVIGTMSSKKKRAMIMWTQCLLAGLTVAAPAPRAAAVENNLEGKHAAPARTTYRIVNLGNGEYIGPALINAVGHVAFSQAADSDSPPRAFYYDGKSVQDIGTLGANFARVTGLNDEGQVTGVSQTSAGVMRAFVWSKRRGMIDIGVLPGAASSWEPAINRHGVVTGYSHGDPVPYPRAFRWSLSTGMEDLGGLAGGADTISYGRAINDAGLIAGNSLTPGYDYHAFAWTPATGMVDIDTLGSGYSDAIGVGARGQVGGNFFVDGGSTRGFVWTRAGGMRDLGNGGGEGTWFVHMTDSARMAGLVTSAAFNQRAITWTRDSGIVPLGTLGGNSSNAVSANNKGQVVGGAATAADDWRAFVWSAAEGMVDLNTRLRGAPAGLSLYSAQAVSDNGAILAMSNAGLLLLAPGRGCGCGHAVGPIHAADVVKVGMPFEASVSFAGEDRTAQHHVTWSWGDGNGERSGSALARGGVGRATGSHAFAAPGMYTVSARVTDLAGKSVTVSRKIVAVDPSRGMAGGAGRFVSPHVPNKKALFQAGPASFAFVVPATANGGRNRVSGQLEFQVGKLRFRSKQLQATTAHGQYAGTGSINGAGNYQFSMTARAGKGEGQGHFSLRIWHADAPSGTPLVAYDSQGGQRGAAQNNQLTGVIMQ